MSAYNNTQAYLMYACEEGQMEIVKILLTPFLIQNANLNKYIFMKSFNIITF